MKAILKKYGLNKWSASALIIAYFTVPIIPLKGNPTAWDYTHDHMSRYTRLNSINLDNHKVASIKMDYSALLESRRGLMLQDYKMQLMFLEDKATRINESSHYTDKEKNGKMLKLERRLDRLYDKVDDGGFRLEELRSANDKMMIAMSKQ